MNRENARLTQDLSRHNQVVQSSERQSAEQNRALQQVGCVPMQRSGAAKCAVLVLQEVAVLREKVMEYEKQVR